MSPAADDVVKVAEAFGVVARALAVQEDVQATLDRIVHLAVETLEACEYAGITVITKGEVTSPASSGEVPRIVDRIQSETGEGPCVDAIKEHEVFQTGDLSTEDRWQRFSARAHLETGVRSVLSLRLFVEEETMGSLNLYAAERDAFDETDLALASVFAVHAAVAMSSTRREVGLEEKARTRDVIGQAKGMLMARSGVDEDRAFEMLKQASQRMNVRLRELASQIVDGTQLPGPRE